MTDRSTLSPNGWFNDWVAQAQLYPGYNGNANNGLNKTVAALSGNTNLNQAFPPGIDPSNDLLLDAYMTYYGSGNVADNRLGALSKAQLVTGGKTPWAISKDMGQNFRPMITVYLNDASTSESTFNLLTDISSSGGTTNNQSMPVNVLANAALQIGAFLGARIASANPGAGIDPTAADLNSNQISTLHNLKYSNFITGDVLLTPDGFGSFIKNYSTTNPIVNDTTTSTIGSIAAGKYNVTLSATADGKGWNVLDLQGNIYKTIPGSVSINGVNYSVQETLVNNKGNLIPVLQAPDGSQYCDIVGSTYKSLNLKASDTVNARQNLQDALQYLKSIQPTYEKYGVVFPDIFYASGSEFNTFCNTLPGYSPAPGIQLPGLSESTGNSVADLLATQTYLAKLFAGRLNVAHVLNPWAVGGIDAAPWYLDGTMFQDGSNLLKGLTTASAVRAALDSVATQVSDKAATLGWFKASPYMDYLSIDKYERDEISGVVNASQHNAYNRNAWINYAYYGKVLSESLRTGPDSASGGNAAAGNGNSDLLYYQIPAASLPADLANGSTAPFINGLTGKPGGTDLSEKMTTAGSDIPHYSFAFDSFFGNPDLASASSFKSKYPELSSLSVNVQGQAINLTDYLFSTSANALEDAGSHNLSEGLLSISRGAASVNRAVLGDVFGIIWGGGNSSTPLAYGSSQWGDPNATWTAGSSLDTAYVPNSQTITPLANSVDRLTEWAAADYSGPTSAKEVNVRSLGLTYAAIKTDSTGKLSLAVCAQAINNNAIYLYKLNSATDTDAISGLSLNGNNPNAGSAGAYFQEVSSNNIAVTSNLSTSSAGQNNGQQISSLAVSANSYYGILLVSKTSSGQTFSSSSYAAAGSWDGTTTSDRGLPAAALVDASEISSQFFGGTVTFIGSRVLGFEDNILTGNSDFDYNDTFLAVTSGGSILI